MAQVLVNFRMDQEDKIGMEEVCKELGMSMTTAFTIFAKKMRREREMRKLEATCIQCSCKPMNEWMDGWMDGWEKLGLELRSCACFSDAFSSYFKD